MSKRMLIVIGVLIMVVVIFIIQGRNPNSGQSSSGNSTGQCQVKVTASVLNVRASPETDASQVAQFPAGKVIDADKTVQNGFREINANQWVSNAYVTPVSGAC